MILRNFLIRLLQIYFQAVPNKLDAHHPCEPLFFELPILNQSSTILPLCFPELTTLCFETTSFMLLPCHFSISLLSKFLCTFITGNKGPFLAKLTKDGDYEYVKSFYTGYDDDGKRGTGHVSCDKNGNLFFATNYVNSLSLGVRLLKQGLNPLVKVYPNPCRGTLNTGYISGVAGEIGIQVYNFFGQEVFATTKNTTPGNNTYTLDLSTLQPSMYFLSITKGQKTVATNKFIVKK